MRRACLAIFFLGLGLGEVCAGKAGLHKRQRNLFEPRSGGGGSDDVWTSPGRLRHLTPALMTGAPRRVPVHKPPKTHHKATFKLRDARCCEHLASARTPWASSTPHGEPCLEQQERGLNFEHRLLNQNRHQNLHADSGHILETNNATMRETRRNMTKSTCNNGGVRAPPHCARRNQRRGHHGQAAIRTKL